MKELPEKLWDLANLITGFAVAQMMALVFSLTVAEFRIRLVEIRWIMLAPGVLFNLAMLWAVWWCHSVASKLVKDSGQVRAISLRVTIGRMTVVMLAGTIALALPFLLAP